ncbi:MAG: SLC13 family permease [Thermoplasmatota archaeon]
MAVWEIGVVLAVLVVVLLLFVREVLPPAITSMLAAASLMVLPARSWSGPILSPEEGLSGFASQATIAVLSMFVLSAGIERSGAVDYLSRALTRWAGKGVRRQTLTLGGVAGGMSGFVNNTPVVAVLIPVASRLARQAGHSPSKLLMPLSFFAMLGGTLTLIGTSTNLLGNALLPRYGLEPFGFFSFTLVGVVALAAAAIYFLTIGPLLVPDRGTGDATERFDLKGFLAEVHVPGDAQAVGKTIGELGLTRPNGFQVLRLFRGDIAHSAPRKDFVVREDDLLLLQGSREGLEELQEQHGLVSLAELKHGLEPDPESGEEGWATAELVVAPGSRVEGRTLAEMRFRDRFDAIVLALRHHDRLSIGPLAQSTLKAGDVLLVQAPESALDRLEESANFFLTRERKEPVFRPEKILMAAGIMIAVVAVSALGLLPIVAAALAGAVAMVVTGCLKVEEFIDAIHWDIILLLSGIIPLGIALEKSGAAALMADGLVAVGGLLPPLAFLMAVFLFTSLLTEMISNNASVVLLIPIVVAAAASLGLDGRPFALAVMLSASTSMLTPVGYQTNTMVYAPGSYRFSDFVRVGGPLNLALVVIIPLTIAWLFPL